MRERSTQVLKVALTHVVEHFDFFGLHTLEHILVVKGLKEGGGRLAA